MYGIDIQESKNNKKYRNIIIKDSEFYTAKSRQTASYAMIIRDGSIDGMNIQNSKFIPNDKNSKTYAL
jgi:hypothetical protein